MVQHDAAEANEGMVRHASDTAWSSVLLALAFAGVDRPDEITELAADEAPTLNKLQANIIDFDSKISQASAC
jgi:hypothetical protein